MTLTVTPYTTPSNPGGGTDIEDEYPPLANVDGNLNTTDHFAYIIGRGENCVQPLENITRAEAMTIINRMLDRDWIALEPEWTANNGASASAQQ